MTGATLCSGVGCPEIAAPWIDWKFCAEILKFPARVLKARFPHVPNLGDLTAPDFIDRARATLAGATLDVLVFGSPCQSFSVAGGRLGMDDPRGNLALICLGVVRALRPRWFVFENVPGLLSSWSGDEGQGRSDFAEFLRTVAECGYAGGWATLDAQWFGVAQRRRRVFFVGHAGDWRYPAGVLAEFHRLRGNPPTRQGSREAGEAAGTLAGRTRGGGGLGTDFEFDGDIVSHTLRSEGHDASEDGTERGIPIVAQTITAGMYNSGGAVAGNNDQGVRNVIAVNLRGREGGAMPEPSGVASVRAASGGSSRSFVCFGPNQVTSKANRSNPTASGLRRLTPVECERLQGLPDNWTAIDVGQRRISPGMARYLTGHGLECWEADGQWFTRVAADGPRYKAIGNGMAVPVIGHLLSSIRALSTESIKNDDD